MASALAYRDFRLLWASSLCPWSSQWIQQAALGWVVHEITGSGALLGAVRYFLSPQLREMRLK